MGGLSEWRAERGFYFFIYSSPASAGDSSAPQRLESRWQRSAGRPAVPPSKRALSMRPRTPATRLQRAAGEGSLGRVAGEEDGGELGSWGRGGSSTSPPTWRTRRRLPARHPPLQTAGSASRGREAWAGAQGRAAEGCCCCYQSLPVSGPTVSRQAASRAASMSGSLRRCRIRRLGLLGGREEGRVIQGRAEPHPPEAERRVSSSPALAGAPLPGRGGTLTPLPSLLSLRPAFARGGPPAACSLNQEGGEQQEVPSGRGAPLAAPLCTLSYPSPHRHTPGRPRDRFFRKLVRRRPG